MTYALALNCIDGVVLVADTKFIINGGSDYDYDYKITGEIRGVLTVFAGNREPFEDFTAYLREYGVEMDKKKEEIRTDELSIRIREIMRALDSHYGNYYKFDVLAGISTNEGSKIRYFYQDGRPEKVKRYKAIGSGSTFPEIYLKKHWHDNITMDEAAQLGFLAVRYIEKFKLDQTVRTGLDKPLPQVKFIPNKPLADDRLDYSPSKEDYERYEKNTQQRLAKIETSVVNDYTIQSS
jgi:20S proteasome alpha/beta subunit